MYRKKKTFLIPIAWMMSIGFVLLIFAPATLAQSERFLPFQGRLTDSAGKPVSDGQHKIQFEIYDAPTDGATVWDGEIHTVMVSGGLVSVVLGTKTPFDDSFAFNKTLYLEITVDVNGDSVINQDDPPMLPRQLIVPAIFAQETDTLEGNRWKDFFTVPAGAPGDSDPAKNPMNAKVKDADLFDGIDSAAVFVDPANMTDPKVKIAAVADYASSGSLTLNYGDAILEDGFAVISFPGRFDLEGMSVTLTSTGRPVLIQLFVATDEQQIYGTGCLYIQRDGTDVGSYQCGHVYYSNSTFKMICIDCPPAGEHTYKVQAKALSDEMRLYGHSTGFNEYKIVVFEL